MGEGRIGEGRVGESGRGWEDGRDGNMGRYERGVDWSEDVMRER